MSKSIKAIFVLSLLLMGCTPVKEEPEKHEVVFPKPVGEVVNSPVSVPYVENNPITVKNITVTETDMTYTSVIEIDGLKDAAVEKKINDAIRARFDALMAFEDLTKLPPFRGIRQKIKDGATLNNLNVYASVAFNANGILSITFNAYVGITNSLTDQVYVNVTDGMTFELAHGTQLTLSDLFTNDATPGTIINASVNRSLMSMNSQDETESGYYWYTHLMQVAPFTGIQADQPFFLSDNGLHLIIDYRTPVFETNLSSYTILVPFLDFGDKIGFTQRFDFSQDLFDSPIIDRQFLWMDDQNERIETLSFGAQDQFRIRLSVPHDLDPAISAKTDTMKSLILEKLTTYVSTNTASYASGAVTALRVGPYTCLYANAEAYADPDGFMFYSDSACFDKAHHQMALKDYFKPGFDYETALKQLIQDEIDKGYLAFDVSIQEIYDTLEVQVSVVGFTFSGKAHSASLNQDQYFGISPAFSAFGIENLTLFD